jgi:hypothetical protein
VNTTTAKLTWLYCCSLLKNTVLGKYILRDFFRHFMLPPFLVRRLSSMFTYVVNIVSPEGHRNILRCTPSRSRENALPGKKNCLVSPIMQCFSCVFLFSYSTLCRFCIYWKNEKKTLDNVGRSEKNIEDNLTLPYSQAIY